MTWLAIFKLLLTLADKIADIIRQSQLLDAGAKAEVAVQLGRIAARLQITDEIRATVDSMSDEDLDKELAGRD